MGKIVGGRARRRPIYYEYLSRGSPRSLGGVWAPRGKCLFVLKLRTRACLLYGVLGRPTPPTDDPNAKPNDFFFFFFDMERDATCFGMPACGRLQR